MLDYLKKFYKEVEKEVEMSVEKPEAQAELANVEAAAEQFATLQASFDTQAAQLAAALESVASLTASLETAKASLEGFEAAATQAVADAEAIRMDARLTTLKANLGDDQAPAIFEATKNLDDTAFAAICSAMGKTLSAEANSDLFTQVGVETKAEANVEQKPVHFNTFMKKESK